MSNRSRSTRARTVTDNPSLVARIDRAIFRLQNTHGLPLQLLGDSSDPEVVLRDCRASLQRLSTTVRELYDAVVEQVGREQTDRLRAALTDAHRAYDESASCGQVDPRAR